MRRTTVLVIALSMLVPSFAMATTGPGLSTISFNESDGCEDPAGFHGPRATRSGYLPDSEPLHGPMADLFGRSIGDVKDQLVWWTVPSSGGHRIRVHSLALPAFELAAANIRAEDPNGTRYPILASQTYGHSQRTIGGRYQVSHHAVGTAIDINTRSNPYRSDNVLVTNMPDWFVEAWVSAGFCWGGNWQEVKDAMHFSWKGPEATPGYPHEVVDKAPVSTKANWTQWESATLKWNLEHEAQFFLRDGNRDGAVDTYRLRNWAGGTLIELSRSSKDYAVCGVWREWSPADPNSTFLLADYDNTSRLDLWELDLSGSTLSATVWLQRDDFVNSASQSTSIPVSTGMVVEAADFNDDGLLDLAVGRPGGSTSVEIWSGASNFTSTIATASVSLATSADTLALSVADVDLDDLPDLAVIDKSSTAAQIVVVSASSGLSTELANVTVSSRDSLTDVAFGEYDGDGRDDIITLDSSGLVKSFLGGTLPSGLTLNNWFRDPSWECPDDEDVDLPDEVGQYLPRISGSDRYSTSASVSKNYFSSADTVIVASGLDFPDALASGPVAATLGGPVLLTNRYWLPGSVANEITRLGATRVIIAGGTGAVSQGVEDAISDLPTVTTIQRAAGLDRFGTADELAKLMPAPTVVYVATGYNYPDALASGPAAAAEGAPVLLVKRYSIPSKTQEALNRIAPDEIVILGGTGVVSDSVANQLASWGTVTRAAGIDRYATAVEIAKRMPDATTFVIVDGWGYADAVGAGAAAAAAGSPIILARSGDLPSVSNNYLAIQQSSHITVVGGSGTISELVRASLIELIYPN